MTGVPIAHKDIFVTADMPTTAGSKMLAGYRSPFDATVVARLKAALNSVRKPCFSVSPIKT
jgi:aspartyl-tRNA(Asn)/glutamyl-tRNA(Gln) amidotransferase subunit A